MKNNDACPECKGTHRVICKDCDGDGMSMGCFCEVCDDDGMQACPCTIRVSRRAARKAEKAAKKNSWVSTKTRD